MLSPAKKQEFSAFAGIAEQRYMAPANKQSTIVGAADILQTNNSVIHRALHNQSLIRLQAIIGQSDTVSGRMQSDARV